MTISLGSSVVNPDGSVSLVAPVGFASTAAVRLTNYTSELLIINNINPAEIGSQEYLAPLQQNVYACVNKSKLPNLQGVSLGTVISTSGVLVEWSTNPKIDFAGKTYPTTVSNGGNAAPSLSIYQLPLVDHALSYSIPANVLRTKLQITNYSGIVVKWSSNDSNWPNNPTITSGSATRTVVSGGAVYFRGASDNAYLEIIEESVSIVNL